MNPILPAALALVFATPLAAQIDQAIASEYVHDQDAPVAAAVRIDGGIRIDGVLDEDVWSRATPITSFTQLDPQEGRPASQQTDVRILYDDQALYIGARLNDTGVVSGRLGRRDMPLGDSDWLTVILDSHHDHRTAFGFEINPAGVRRDQTRATGSGEDDSWDPVWQAAATTGDDGWAAELRIPFSQLRFSGESEQSWGLQVERTIARNREFSVWSFTPREEPGGIPRFGHLTRLADVPTGKRLEILPYTVARAEYVDAGENPFRSDREYELEAGIDLKYRVTSNLTLDATVNPDFGQGRGRSGRHQPERARDLLRRETALLHR
ncbi:MAG: sugar-binding protein, partial [Longimicrobiales bacterium]